ncbi:hypothetical protein SUGI_0027110 [Cryptomeria japonica]|nr:hypothetical protein SUGI_0027110 [Cryptomeria japonica]
MDKSPFMDSFGKLAVFKNHRRTSPEIVAESWPGNCELHGDLILSSSGYPESECTSTAICTKLKSVGIQDGNLASKASVSGEYGPSLKYLVLDSVKNLSAVHLWLAKPLDRLMFENCKQLKSVSGDLDQGKLTQLIISNCSRLQELPRQLASDLSSVEVDLKGIEYLHLSNGSSNSISINKEECWINC